MSFDPYYEWFGIPPDEQPPDYYRLLGVRRFEPNVNVIENAAERQMLLLKTRQNGPHSELTQRLMNEVSSARICLLDTQRRSTYDAKLHERVANEVPSSEPASEVISLPREELPVLDQPWSEDPLQRAPLPRLHPTTASTAPHKRESGGFRRSVELPSIRVSWPVVFGGLATIGVSLIALVWLFWGNDDPRATNDGAGQDPSAESSFVATLERPGQGPAPGSSRHTPNARPPQPPPITQQNKPKESASGLTGKTRTDGSTSTTSEDTNGVEGQHSGSPGSVPPNIQERDGFGNSISGDDDVSDDETARSRLDGRDPSAGLERNAGKRARPNRRNAGKRNAKGDNSQSSTSASAAAGSSPVFDRLPTEFDLPSAIAATGPGSMLLSEQLSFVDADCEILLEDYSSPAGKSKFSIGAASATENLTRWPVISLASADDSPPITQTSAEDTPGEALFAHIEAGPTGLFLRFSASASPELIEQFSLCSLVFRNDSGQHGIQLQASERIPPLTLAFDDSKETVTLDEMPAASLLSLDRMMLEVVRVELGGVQAPTEPGLRANLNKELTVILDSQLQCELGIRLSESDGQFTIVVLPRYIVNDRRQQLVPAEIKKDLARAQSQLTRNQRDLNVAQNNLRSLPQELSRLRGITPSSGQEAAALQVRLGQLETMGSSLQSKIRRLSEVGPKLASSVEQMDGVLTLVNRMSNHLALHYRIIAQGETGDLLLLQTTSAKYDQ